MDSLDIALAEMRRNIINRIIIIGLVVRVNNQIIYTKRVKLSVPIPKLPVGKGDVVVKNVLCRKMG